ERFPSFGQTFCYREVAELERQGGNPDVYSIRRPTGEPPQDWDEEIVRRVQYLPDEKELVREIDQLLRAGKVSLPGVRDAVAKWGRQVDFLRLYQAIHIGVRLKATGVRRVHAHFAGMAARTAWWVRQFFEVPYSFTAHANDIFAPREFVVSLEKLVRDAESVVTVSDYGVDGLRRQFPESARKIRRIYNGVDLSSFQTTGFGSTLPLIVSIGRLIEKK